MAVEANLICGWMRELTAETLIGVYFLLPCIFFSWRHFLYTSSQQQTLFASHSFLKPMASL